MAQHAHAQGVDQRVLLVGGVELGLAADVGQSQAVAVAAHAGHHAVDHACGVRVVHRAEAQLVHDGHGTRSHGDDVAHDAAHAGGRPLVGLNEAGVVVGLDLVGHGPAVTNVHHAGVLAHAHQQVLLHLGRDLGTELLQVDLGALVGAVLGPHDRVHGELGVGGTAPQQLLDGGVLLVLEAELAVGHLLVRGRRGVLNGVRVLDRPRGQARLGDGDGGLGRHGCHAAAPGVEEVSGPRLRIPAAGHTSLAGALEAAFRLLRQARRRRYPRTQHLAYQPADAGW